jgi:hypothetical protein
LTSAANEEARGLLRRIVESLAWRQIATINILGHCLKFINDLDTKLRVASELDLNLRLFRDVRALYSELGWENIEAAVRDRIDRLPYPSSRQEFGVAYHLIGLAESVAMQSYVQSSNPNFAAIALSYVDAAASRPEPTRFVEFCAEPTNRPQAQAFLNRWLTLALLSFGRPGSSADARALELRLRSSSVAEMQQQFLDELQPFLARCSLALPALADLGVVEQAAG